MMQIIVLAISSGVINTLLFQGRDGYWSLEET